MAKYISVYPPAYSATYVKATTTEAGDYSLPHTATDPAISLLGFANYNKGWQSAYGAIANQRFHIDLGVAKVVRRIYYENQHNTGTYTDFGVENFTFWGSNIGAGSFDDLVYANDEGWTQLTTSQATFDQHVGADSVDPKYITVANSTHYRYYAFKFADNYGRPDFLGVRRIELQVASFRPQIIIF